MLQAGAAGSWEANSVGSPSVIKDGSTYKMWYTGLDAAALYGRIGYATSPDGITWTKYAGNPVLDVGAPGSWDTNYRGRPTVVKVGGLYHMWFNGYANSSIGYATSPDGVTWTEYAGNPVIAGGSGGWDNFVYRPCVLYDGAQYHMWYSGENSAHTLSQVGYATSSDGMHWTRKGLVLPQGATGEWDGGSC